MHVFLDDSTSFRRPGYQCFAGFMADQTAFDSLSTGWNRLLEHHGLKHLHTSDFLSAQGDHKNEGRTYEERKLVLADFIELIRRTMQCMIIVGVEKNDYYTYSSKERGGLGTAGFCLQRVAHICHRRIHSFPDPSPLNFVFDDSEKDSPKIYSAWAKMKSRHAIPKGLCASITFAEDHMFYPLQAADLLACAVIQENQKQGERWGEGSPFGPLFKEAPDPPLGMIVDTEYWNAASMKASGVFQRS